MRQTRIKQPMEGKDEVRPKINNRQSMKRMKTHCMSATNDKNTRADATTYWNVEDASVLTWQKKKHRNGNLTNANFKCDRKFRELKDYISRQLLNDRS